METTKTINLTKPYRAALEKIANAGIGRPATARKRDRMIRWGLIRPVANTNGFEITAAGARALNRGAK
jgi:hypothetical protein